MYKNSYAPVPFPPKKVMGDDFKKVEKQPNYLL